MGFCKKEKKRQKDPMQVPQFPIGIVARGTVWFKHFCVRRAACRRAIPELICGVPLSYRATTSKKGRRGERGAGIHAQLLLDDSMH